VICSFRWSTTASYVGLTDLEGAVIVSNMSAQNVKEEARRLVENLPEDVTWDDLMYQIYVRQNIEAGLADSEADRVIEVEEVRKGFGLS
jgi:hypothetical protein